MSVGQLKVDEKIEKMQHCSCPSNGKDGAKIYQASMDKCSQCPYQKRCCQSKKGEARTIWADDKEPLRKTMLQKMKQAFFREVYRKRKYIVEPVLGQIKNNLGFRHFSVRRSPKVGGEFFLVCMAHNFSKRVNAILKGTVSLQSRSLWVESYRDANKDLGRNEKMSVMC